MALVIVIIRSFFVKGQNNDYIVGLFINAFETKCHIDCTFYEIRRNIYLKLQIYNKIPVNNK